MILSSDSDESSSKRPNLSLDVYNRNFKEILHQDSAVEKR